jgi:hypothetical protein
MVTVKGHVDHVVFQMVTVKGHVDHVVTVVAGRMIATHPRSLEGGRPVLDPIHYLATLERKPGALDHTPVYRDWMPPVCICSAEPSLPALVAWHPDRV